MVSPVEARQGEVLVVRVRLEACHGPRECVRERERLCTSLCVSVCLDERTRVLCRWGVPPLSPSLPHHTIVRVPGSGEKWSSHHSHAEPKVSWTPALDGGKAFTGLKGWWCMGGRVGGRGDRGGQGCFLLPVNHAPGHPIGEVEVTAARSLLAQCLSAVMEHGVVLTVDGRVCMPCVRACVNNVQHVHAVRTTRHPHSSLSSPSPPRIPPLITPQQVVLRLGRQPVPLLLLAGEPGGEGLGLVVWGMTKEERERDELGG